MMWRAKLMAWLNDREPAAWELYWVFAVLGAGVLALLVALVSSVVRA